MIERIIEILISMFVGFCIAIGVQYPLNMDEFSKAINICKDHDGVERITLGFTGMISTVACKDTTKYQLDH